MGYVSQDSGIRPDEMAKLLRMQTDDDEMPVGYKVDIKYLIAQSSPDVIVDESLATDTAVGIYSTPELVGDEVYRALKRRGESVGVDVERLTEQQRANIKEAVKKFFEAVHNTRKSAEDFGVRLKDAVTELNRDLAKIAGSSSADPRTGNPTPLQRKFSAPHRSGTH